MKEIQLTQDKVSIVDDEDFEYLNQFKWSAEKSGRTFYAVRKIIVDKHELHLRMHNVIFGEKGSDHADNNGLNNQRLNLRKCTHQQNCINRRSRKDSTSNYKGVSFNKESNNWVAQIQINGNKIFLGRYSNELDAALAYDKISIEHFKEFANLNIKK